MEDLQAPWFGFTDRDDTVMHLTVLISLLAVTISQSTSFSPTVKQTLVSALTKTNNEGWTSHSTQQRTVPPTGTSQASAQPPQTSNRIQEHDTAVARQTSKETTPLLSTIFASAVVTSHQKSTSQALPQLFGEDDLRANPGLVAIITIFCIVLALLLIVATVKCIQSPSSDFERLEDVPMDKMNEGSPFARYSK
ncbi:putative LOC729966 homolog [Vanacampus margaritifer]